MMLRWCSWRSITAEKRFKKKTKRRQEENYKTWALRCRSLSVHAQSKMPLYKHGANGKKGMLSCKCLFEWLGANLAHISSGNLWNVQWVKLTQNLQLFGAVFCLYYFPLKFWNNFNYTQKGQWVTFLHKKK